MNCKIYRSYKSFCQISFICRSNTFLIYRSARKQNYEFNLNFLDFVPEITSPTEHREFPVPAARRSVTKRDSEEGFVSVQRRVEPSTALFSISAFQDSKTDYKTIAKFAGNK